MIVTLEREEFVEAVREATTNSRLIEQAKRQTRFPLNNWEDKGCGCVVGEFLKSEGEDPDPLKNAPAGGDADYRSMLIEAGSDIDEFIERIVYDIYPDQMWGKPHDDDVMVVIIGR